MSEPNLLPPVDDEPEKHESTTILASNSTFSYGTTFLVMAHVRCIPEPVPTMITVNELIGKGTFGRVYKAQLDKSDRCVALKQVQLDPYVLNREPEILNFLEGHCNIVRLIMYAQMDTSEISYLLMAMEYMPMTLAKFIFHRTTSILPLIYVRIISYQMFRALGYIHSYQICHRDIKPENMLLDPVTMNLKLADFGSAKLMDTLNATYVCSRFYRAPELFAKCQRYTTKVDIWSAGCVLAELLKGTPLFLSNKFKMDQLLHVVCLLGTSGLENAPLVLDASGITPDTVLPRPSWQMLIGDWVPNDLADLLDNCIQYDPNARISPLRACAHASYDELRTMDALNTKMPNGLRLPPLFNFSQHELQVDPGLWMHLLPLQLQEDRDLNTQTNPSV